MPQPPAPLHVLLVDDAQAVREIIALMIEAVGHIPTVADSGAAALAFLEGGLTVDLVLTDYHMPGMNGLELAEEIRRRWPWLRIGLVTGTLEIADTAPPVFDFVLTKPVTATALRQALGAPPPALGPP